MADNDRAEHLANVLDPFWKQVKEYLKDPSIKRPSLFSHLFKIYGLRFLLLSLSLLAGTACSLTIPTFIEEILKFLNPFLPRSLLIVQNGYAIGFSLFALQIGVALFGRSAEQVLRRMQTNIRTIVINATYEKSLRLSEAASREFTQGRILNLINVDSESISLGINGIYGFIGTPIQIGVSVYLIGRLLGYSVWAGAGALFGVLIIQACVIGFLASFQKGFLKAGDRRLKSIREMLYGIKIIKFRTLENFFFEKISAIRDEQVGILKYTYTIQVFFVGLLQVTPVAMPIAAFIAYSSAGGNISPQFIFPALSLFNLLFQPLLILPSSITQLVNGVVSWNRLTAFLLAGEGESLQIQENNNMALTLEDSVFQWKAPKVVEEEPKEKKRRKKSVVATQVKEDFVGFNLGPLSFQVAKNSLVAIVGPVGCGKSSLLSGIIGEMPQTQGKTIISQSIAYCAQQPWILTETLQGNILFNSSLDKDRLDTVVTACCLDPDIKELPGGILTELGEKGVNLSGGQKARVSLARALYQNSGIYLLDDPFAALDAHVGEAVFERVVKDYLKQKTVLLVTHQLQFLPKVDHILVMENGKIVEQGHYSELISSGGVLARMMKNYKLDKETDKETVKKEEKKTEKEGDEKGGLIMAQEERRMGAVKWSTFWSYFKACGGYPYLAVVVLSAICAQITRLVTDLWLSWWTSNRYGYDNMTYLRIYAGLGGSQVFFSLILNTCILAGAYQASKYFHKAALKRLMFSPMSFFESQPIGRILNRMSKDVEVIDQILWLFLFLTIISFTGLISTFVLMVYTSPIMLCLAIPLIIIYFFILRFYQATNRELRRLEAIQRSPLYAHVSETLAGLSSVKAYKVEKEFIHRQRSLMDFSNSPAFLKLISVVWVNVRIELLASTVTLLLVILGITGWVDTQVIGLALTYSIGLNGLINLLLVAYAQLESELNAVERLDGYAELPQESAYTLTQDPSQDTWPLQGQLVFDHIEFSYDSRPDIPILNDLSFTIQPGEKIGIVGRTGSGKSTIMTALFRLVELRKGRILIDDVDISTLGLSCLRSRIQIIPQEPVLFAGSIRSNLDVESKYQDVDLWQVLELIGLKDYVTSLEDKLDSIILENGENLSVGQRQLMCLGRAILVKPRILIMDEATASVDNEADTLIQKSIKTHFAKTTVLAIAHRLNTIIDFDRIIVLDQGKLVEFDTPKALLQKDSYFSKLVDATGQANAQLLRSIAFGK